MTEAITIGLARMHVEFGERRDFLPTLVADLEKRGAQVFLGRGQQGLEVLDIAFATFAGAGQGLLGLLDRDVGGGTRRLERLEVGCRKNQAQEQMR